MSDDSSTPTEQEWNAAWRAQPAWRLDSGPDHRFPDPLELSAGTEAIAVLAPLQYRSLLPAPDTDICPACGAPTSETDFLCALYSTAKPGFSFGVTAFLHQVCAQGLPQRAGPVPVPW